MNARYFLSTSEQEQIAQAIGAAEKQTSAEVFCAVATESGRYDRAESIVGLCAALLGLGVAHAFRGGLLLGQGEWSDGAGVALGWQCLAVVVGFVIGTFTASHVHPFRRLFVAGAEMDDETWKAASHVFTLRRADSIRSRSALLIYASLFERRVVVLAAKDAADALGEGGLRELRDLAVNRLREGRRAEMFTDAVRLVAERLREALPAAGANPDELSNKLMILHPRP
jgi:uncharacterized membrane protein